MPKRSDQLKPYHFKPGQSGNPDGKPKGLLNKMNQFRETMFGIFAQNPDLVQKAYQRNPLEFSRILSALCPKDFNIKGETTSRLVMLFDKKDMPKAEETLDDGQTDNS